MKFLSLVAVVCFIYITHGVSLPVLEFVHRAVRSWRKSGTGIFFEPFPSALSVTIKPTFFFTDMPLMVISRVYPLLRNKPRLYRTVSLTKTGQEDFLIEQIDSLYESVALPELQLVLIVCSTGVDSVPCP
jgi:hypothetical protein